VREDRGALDVPYLRGLGADETLGQERSLAYMLDGTRSTIGWSTLPAALPRPSPTSRSAAPETSDVPDRVRYQFTGRERDTDWLYYYRAGTTTRGSRGFFSRIRSPRRRRQSVCVRRNNPLSFIDPSGLRTYAAHGCCQSAESLEKWGPSPRLSETPIPMSECSRERMIFFNVSLDDDSSEALLETILRDLDAQPSRLEKN